ncbi:hypothetical protein [Kordia sp.]
MRQKNSTLGTILMKELSNEELLEIKGGYNPWLDNDDTNEDD